MATDKVRQAFEQLDRVKELRSWGDCAEAQERDSELDDLWEGFRAGAAYAQSAAPTPDLGWDGKYMVVTLRQPFNAGQAVVFRFLDGVATIEPYPLRESAAPPAERPQLGTCHEVSFLHEKDKHAWAHDFDPETDKQVCVGWRAPAERPGKYPIDRPCSATKAALDVMAREGMVSSEPVQPAGPSCTVCGRAMVGFNRNGTCIGYFDSRVVGYKCLSCGSTPGPTEPAQPTTHRTRMSDSSLYDEVCIDCGATDRDGGLNEPCTRPFREAGQPVQPATPAEIRCPHDLEFYNCDECEDAAMPFREGTRPDPKDAGTKENR